MPMINKQNFQLKIIKFGRIQEKTTKHTFNR